MNTVLVETSILKETSKTSYALTRAPGPRHESVKGSSTNLPFMPGGLEEKDDKNLVVGQEDSSVDWDDSKENEIKLFEELFDRS